MLKAVVAATVRAAEPSFAFGGRPASFCLARVVAFEQPSGCAARVERA